MKLPAFIAFAILFVPLQALAGDKNPDTLDQWPQWRGPLSTGVAPHGNPPLSWSEDEHIRWKVAIPGKGHSSPIVWDDRVIISTAVEYGEALQPPHAESHGAHDNLSPTRRQKFVVIALNRTDGTILWERTLRDQQPHEGTHSTGSRASNSPVTDGEHVFVSFGSQGIYCLNMDGKLVWEKDLGDMHTRHGHGEGSSPALYADTLIINWDHQGDSFVTALDKRTGKQRWKVARDEITSWSTPLIVEHDGKPQVVISATKRVRSYDLTNGDLLWECGGLSRNVVASPVAADGLVYVANSYDWQAMIAIRLAVAKGDITDTDAVAWSRDRDTPYVPSPLLYGGQLYFLKHNQGFMTCVDAKSGPTLFDRQRLPDIGHVFASPVAAADRVYVASRDGTTVVLKHGAKFEVLARNALDDSFSASPAMTCSCAGSAVSTASPMISTSGPKSLRRRNSTHSRNFR
jgi:outer membrane protein assembly factor BamB